MGGCRCFYRNCKVNSYKHIGMHFFRFPIKDTRRCDLWITYSQQYDFYQRPLGRQKNRTLCGRHFRDECFMNFKKDRLVATAVPSIHRLSKDKALDYELDITNGMLVTLPEVEQSHLIAPEGFECPLGFGFDIEVSELLRSLENGKRTEEFDHDAEVAEPSTNNIISSDCVEILETIGIPENIRGIKRSANCLLGEETPSDEGNEAAKRSRTSNPTVGHSSSNIDATIVIAETSETTIQPTIINHQIMDGDGRLWLQSETFSIHDDAGYEFVEIKSQSEQSDTEQVQDIANQLLEENLDQDNLSLTEGLHLSHKLDAAFIEIDDLRAQLKEKAEKIKKLESRLSVSRMACKLSEQQVDTLKLDITELQNANENLEAKNMEVEILKLHVEDEKEKSTNLEKELFDSKQEFSSTKNQLATLNTLIASVKSENNNLKKDIQNSLILNEKQKTLRQEYDQQLKSQKLKHLQIEQQLQQQIVTLKQSLGLAGQQLTEANINLSSLKTECDYIKTERLNSAQKVLELERQLQKMQEICDDKDEQHTKLESCYESLQKSNEKLKADYKMLECNQHQVSTVTTSKQQQQPAEVSAVTTLTKGQLFNGIKRYVSSSMCSLLRMEMFGSSEREWKPDERQAAVDLLRLGEFVYKYLTDEWRFRLPALRDVRTWLSQSVAVEDDEDI